VLKFDVRKEEGAVIDAAMKSASASDAVIKLEQQGKSLTLPIKVTWSPGELKFQLVLDVTSEATLPDQIGDVKFTGKVAGMPPFEHVLKVKLTFSDKGRKIFMKILPFLIIAVVLLALLIWYLMLARWKDHQLRYFQNNNLDTRNYHRDMGAGFMKRSAVGTPQLPSILDFRITGTKGKPSVTAMPMKVALTVQGTPVSAPRELKHGDELVIESEKTLYRFIYFEKEPTAEEIQAALGGLIAGDEIFLEE